MITCKRAAELISRSEETPPGWWAWLQLHSHLALCGMCARFRRKVRLLQRPGRECGEPFPQESLSEEARCRMKRALQDGSVKE